MISTPTYENSIIYFKVYSASRAIFELPIYLCISAKYALYPHEFSLGLVKTQIIEKYTVLHFFLFFGNKGKSNVAKISSSDQNCSFRSKQNKTAYSLNFQVTVNINCG